MFMIDKNWVSDVLGQPHATLTIGAATRNPNYRGSRMQP